jgi:hypothetical protein
MSNSTYSKFAEELLGVALEDELTFGGGGGNSMSEVHEKNSEKQNTVASVIFERLFSITLPLWFK